MKKTIYLSICSLFLAPCSLLAQQYQLPESSFEKWEDKTSPYYGPYLEFETEYFYTLNSLFRLQNDAGAANRTAWREGNGAQQHGTYCIRLTSGRVAVGTGYVFLPGMVGTISQGFVNEFLNQGGEVTTIKAWEYDTPHLLEGYYKYQPVAGDSALIEIGFYNYSGEVFAAKKIIKETVNEWTHFSVPIPEQYWNDVFLNIRVLFVASAGVNFEDLDECDGQLESTLWVDNISLNYTYQGNDIKQNFLSTLKANVFPNPATEVLNVELNENFTGTISVYNVTGNKVMEENINGTQCQLNTSALATGNYIYKLMTENTIFAQGKFVITK
ncbi:MAG: T9SS type A sorting domain-containing protein [Lentimicrobiaceae bacterium]|nr:T9SS type A sorting domain-containing protein [Lentimicrobiaceae bacterium]